MINCQKLLVYLFVIALNFSALGLVPETVSQESSDDAESASLERSDDDQTPSVVYTDNPNIAIPDDGYVGGFGAGMACATMNTISMIPAGSVVTNTSLRISITHTWIGDLTIKLRSPNGTILTVLNRPGGAAPDDGTDAPVGDSSNWANSLVTFADGAGPEAETMGGTLADAQNICTNDGICSHDPSPDTVVTPPITTFSGFEDEPAAGIWTLCVGDSAPVDVGTLSSWQLDLTYGATFSSSPNTSIPDDGYVGGFGGVGQNCSTITVPILTGGGTVTQAPYLRIDLLHSWVGDLTIKLRSPNNTILTVLNRPGSAAADDGGGAVGEDSNWNGILKFRDGGGPEAETMGAGLTTDQIVCTTNGVCSYDPSPDTATQPPTNFAAFNGGSVSGNWTLCIGDSALGDVGTLRSWQIIFPNALAPTAAGVSVSGRVLTPLGSAISRARVVLTGADGAETVASTNAFGEFTFEDVTVGVTYLVNVEARGYTFETRTLSVADEVTGFDFVGQPSIFFKQR